MIIIIIDFKKFHIYLLETKLQNILTAFVLYAAGLEPDKNNYDFL